MDDLKVKPKAKLTKCMSLMLEHETWEKLVVLKTFKNINVPAMIRESINKIIERAEASDGCER